MLNTILEALGVGVLGGAFGFLIGWVVSILRDYRENKQKLRHNKSLSAVMADASNSGGLDSAMPKMRFCVHGAINGRFLEIATYKFNPNGPDWSSEFYLLGQEEKLSEAIATVMLMKGLSQ